MDEWTEHLSWFLGPKGENGRYFESLLVEALRDNVYWRRNYYPGDPALIGPQLLRSFESSRDDLSKAFTRMLAELRRNFPFNSPRYIAHELSDVTLASWLGYFAAMLHNPNNVTPEAAPVTVVWEIEACNELLKMLGFKPSPALPPPGTDPVSYYAEASKQVYGWCHVTSGGTVANMEALWVARNVRYFPLSVRAACLANDIPLRITIPNGTPTPIIECEERDLLYVTPSEATHLYGRFLEAVRQKFAFVARPSDLNAIVNAKAADLLRNTGKSLEDGMVRYARDFPPVVLTSGAAHYSVKKASDLLGFGRTAVRPVAMDSNFRMDPRDLIRQVRRAYDDGCAVVAVVVMAGTTEEGALDPIHEIYDARKTLHNEGKSFWLHIDSAWGGYIRSVFVDDDRYVVPHLALKAARQVGYKERGDLATLTSTLKQLLTTAFGERSVLLHGESQPAATVINRAFKAIGNALLANEWTTYRIELEELWSALKPLAQDPESWNLRLTMADRESILADFTRDPVTLSWAGVSTERELIWGDRYRCHAFMAFTHADSITVDPHKLGYAPYPCGAIAFRNDRVRHFILQRAPYITSINQDVMVHLPPRHAQFDVDTEPTYGIPSDDGPITEAFAPYILEGSRPGAAAAGLWLATKSVPLTMAGHGKIIRASLLAARELWEWLTWWKELTVRLNERQDRACPFDLVTLTPGPPDTNLVVFVVKAKGNNSLKAMNDFTEAVYRVFTIDAELGANQYSYSQPFFLSTTVMTKEHYAFESVEPFLRRCSFPGSRIPQQYAERGIRVLRATVMSPYIQPLRRETGYSYVKRFMEALVEAADKVHVAAMDH